MREIEKGASIGILLAGHRETAAILLDAWVHVAEKGQADEKRSPEG